MDQFTAENEGTYTLQIHDGKAKSQSSLVLIGDGRLPTRGGARSPSVGGKTPSRPSPLPVNTAFKAVLDEAEFQRKEFLRKQGRCRPLAHQTQDAEGSGLSVSRGRRREPSGQDSAVSALDTWGRPALRPFPGSWLFHLLNIGNGLTFKCFNAPSACSMYCF